MNNQLDIFGPYPLPYGGISVHIKGVEDVLIKKGIPYTIYDHGFNRTENVIPTKKSVRWYIQYFFKTGSGVFHLHTFFMFHYIWSLFYSWTHFRKRIILTIHTEDILEASPIKRRLVYFALRMTRYECLISVSKNLSRVLEKKNIKHKFLPAYVPPTDLIPKKMSIEGKRLFMFSVSKLTEGTAHMYGVALAMKLIQRLKGEYHMLFLIGTDDQESDATYLESLKAQYNVAENMTVKYEERIVDWIQNCEFLLRSNTSDAFGISIMESLDMNVPAIASDVCERPAGSVVFENENLEDLLEKVNEVSTKPTSEIMAKHKPQDFHLELVKIYEGLLK